MPLNEITANSKEELISKIVKKEMESGKSQEQALAIAYEEAKKRGYKDIVYRIKKDGILQDSGKVIKKYSGFIVQIKEGLYVSSPTNKTTKNEGMAAVIETEEEAKWLLEWHLKNMKDVEDSIKYRDEILTYTNKLFTFKNKDRTWTGIDWDGIEDFLNRQSNYPEAFLPAIYYKWNKHADTDSFTEELKKNKSCELCKGYGSGLMICANKQSPEYRKTKGTNDTCDMFILDYSRYTKKLKIESTSNERLNQTHWSGYGDTNLTFLRNFRNNKLKDSQEFLCTMCGKVLKYNNEDEIECPQCHSILEGEYLPKKDIQQKGNKMQKTDGKDDKICPECKSNKNVNTNESNGKLYSKCTGCGYEWSDPKKEDIKRHDGFQGMICDKCGSDRVIEGKANNWECKDCGNTTKFRHGDMKAKDVHVKIGERITPLAKTPYQNGFTYFGKQSCQSCRNVDYNGQKCNCTVSPNYGKQITTKDWCRYHFATLHVKSLKS